MKQCLKRYQMHWKWTKLHQEVDAAEWGSREMEMAGHEECVDILRQWHPMPTCSHLPAEPMVLPEHFSSVAGQKWAQITACTVLPRTARLHAPQQAFGRDAKPKQATARSTVAWSTVAETFAVIDRNIWNLKINYTSRRRTQSPSAAIHCKD